MRLILLLLALPCAYAYQSTSLYEQRKELICPNATTYENGGGLTTCNHIMSCAYRDPMITITGDGRDSYIHCFTTMHQMISMLDVEKVMNKGRQIFNKQRELEDSRTYSTNTFNFRHLLKTREDIVVSEFMSSIMTTRTEMDSNALYIQQKASAREVPVQIIVQRVNDYVWNVENHAAQLTILANTFDQYRNELRDTHVTIILEGKKQEVMMQELNAMRDTLRLFQTQTAQHAWANYLKTV